MKLELKHLAPYLPFELKLYLPVHDTTHLMRSLSLIFINREIYYRDIKPILRPLSDLTKEIEHNGERFVPTDRLYFDFDRHGLNGFDFQDIEKTPLEYPFNIVIQLFEWNFDVFNLIEQGLAIDINTLKPTT